jgi:hypothetical protein
MAGREFIHWPEFLEMDEFAGPAAFDREERSVHDAVSHGGPKEET